MQPADASGGPGDGEGPPRSRRRAAALLRGAILSAAGAGSALAGSAPALVLAVTGEEEVLLDHDLDACEAWDIPDTPTRAFRDAAGDIRLFQTHHRNRASIGRSFGTLRHRCEVVFAGKDDPAPATFDNLGWIAATFSPDGRTVYGIVHNEFHGDRAAGCRTGEDPACWYNTLTAVVSRNSGERFEPTRPRLVAALPLRADETFGEHAGYFEPTNILAYGGAFYMMANVVSPPPQLSGNCLLRTGDLSDAAAWRGWREGAFGTRFADPYGPEPIEPEAQLCDPVAPAALPWPVTSLVRHIPSGRFVATMKGRRTGEDGVERTGVFYATSRDLLEWEGPALLLEASINDACAPAEPIAYPALIDPESPDRNFGTIGDTALLTYVRMRPDGCKPGADRDVVMRRVSAAEPAP